MGFSVDTTSTTNSSVKFHDDRFRICDLQAIDRQTDRQTNKQTGRQADRQTVKFIYFPSNKQMDPNAIPCPFGEGNDGQVMTKVGG